MTRFEIRNAWPGLVLLSVLTASLWCTAATAHEVPHDHHGPSAVGAGSVREHLTAFRRTGDDSHLDRAWSMLEPALVAGTDDPHVLVEAAMVAQSQHDFDKALALVNQALSIAGNNDQAWLLGATIHLVRGDVDLAERACGELRQVPMLMVITCRARVSVARGDHAEPLRQLTALLESRAAASLNPDWLAWSFSVAGDAAAPIDPSQAVVLYEQSLRAAESTQVRAALVDVLLTQNRLADADAVLDSGSDALPLAIRRMIVAKRVGRDSAAPGIAAADHEFRHWIAEGDWLHAREMARFYLDVVQRPALARRLAEINLATQREPEDLLLVSRTRDL